MAYVIYCDRCGNTVEDDTSSWGAWYGNTTRQFCTPCKKDIYAFMDTPINKQVPIRITMKRPWWRI